MIGRLAVFLAQRFGPHVLAVVLWMAAIDVLTQQVSGERVRFSPLTLLGMFTAVLINAATRTTDEIKDVEVDRAFFPDRPLVKGHVTVREVYGLTFFLVGLVLVANVVWPIVVGTVIAALVFLFFMATWYFIPHIISNNRVLAIASNCPVYYLVCLQQAQIAVRSHGLHGSAAAPYAVSGLMMLPFLSYEFARKTFLPEDERPGYQTYSALLGLRTATAIGFGLAVLHFAWLFALRSGASASTASLVATAGLGVMVVTYGVFAGLVLVGKSVPRRALELSSGAYFVGGLLLLTLAGVATGIATIAP